jgi:hypothetical protein
VAALAWLIIPLAAAVAAACWGRWASGHQATGDGASLASYERFRAAMENGKPASKGTGPLDALADPAPDASRPPKRRRTADTKAQGGSGEEDSPRGPVAGQVP